MPWTHRNRRRAPTEGDDGIEQPGGGEGVLCGGDEGGGGEGFIDAVGEENKVGERRC